MTKIIFLGWLKDMAGTAEHHMDLPPMTKAQDLINIVAGENTELAQQLAEPSIRIIINKSILIDQTLPDEINEVAFMPPLSGG